MPFTWGGTFSDTMRIFGLVVVVVILCSSNAVAAANTDDDDGNCATECGLSTLLLVIFPLKIDTNNIMKKATTLNTTDYHTERPLT